MSTDWIPFNPFFGGVYFTSALAWRNYDCRIEYLPSPRIRKHLLRRPIAPIWRALRTDNAFRSISSESSFSKALQRH